MSGLMALLDDVAALAKLAATSVDDVAGQAAKAGSKAAGAVIDDAAVTPKYMQGFSPARELPMVWRIARASLFNKLVFLLPAGLALSAFAPWMIPPLLMLGGGYLCFEGAEKIAHALGFGKGHGGPDGSHAEGDKAHLEEEKVAGAIKTDFILSAEIMTIALAAIPESNFWMEAATLAMVAVGITALVYGAVALIVKADDAGLFMAERAAWPDARLGARHCPGHAGVHEAADDRRHRRDALGGWVDHPARARPNGLSGALRLDSPRGCRRRRRQRRLVGGRGMGRYCRLGRALRSRPRHRADPHRREIRQAALDADHGHSLKAPPSVGCACMRTALLQPLIAKKPVRADERQPGPPTRKGLPNRQALK